MNRRSFLSAMLRAGAGFALLPAATTYARRWVKAGPVLVPYWTQTTRSSFCYDDTYRCVIESVTQETMLYSHTWTVEVPTLEYARIQYATAKDLDEVFV